MIARYLGGRSTTRYNKQYTGFRGVDFSVPPEKVDAQHSPDAVNVMLDENGNLIKRPGYRVLANRLPGVPVALHVLNNELIAHCSFTDVEKRTDCLYNYTKQMMLSEIQPSDYSTSVVMNNKLWILTGNEYLCYDGRTILRVSDIAHVPTISISCDPKTGGGKTLEAVNLMTAKRKIQYIGDGTTHTYCIPEGYNKVISATVNGVEQSCLPEDATHIRFAEAPPAPEVTGQDNVIITYEKINSEALEFINKCRYMGTYGLGGADSDRIFFTGNPEKPNADWHCDISAPKYAVDPTYVPDTSFALLGSDSSAIMGYRRLGNYQVILKEQSAQDATAYLRSYGLDDKGEAYFSVKEGISGIGCVNPRTLANLGDEPLFLSAFDGVCAVVNSYVTQATSIQNRSWMVDAKLKKEILKTAFALEWKDKYLLFANGRVYLLDSRQNKTYKERSNSSFVYEAFYWEGIEAKCAVEFNGEIYLGMSNNRLAKLSTDLDTEERYKDKHDVYDGEESAVAAYWTTPLDEDGYPTRTKSINSEWLAFQSNGEIGDIKISYRTTANDPWKTLRVKACERKFDFYLLDFADIDFAAAEPLGDTPIHTKIKKYLRLQLRVENAVKGQNFPLAGIFKSFTYGDQNKIK